MKTLETKKEDDINKKFKIFDKQCQKGGSSTPPSNKKEKIIIFFLE